MDSEETRIFDEWENFIIEKAKNFKKIHPPESSRLKVEYVPNSVNLQYEIEKMNDEKIKISRLEAFPNDPYNADSLRMCMYTMSQIITFEQERVHFFLKRIRDLESTVKNQQQLIEKMSEKLNILGDFYDAKMDFDQKKVDLQVTTISDEKK